MIKRFCTFILWLAIASSLAMIASKLPAMYRAGALATEFPNVLFSLIVICSPYIFMLFRVSTSGNLRFLQINHAVFSTLIALSGIGILFALFYITPDGQGAFAVIGLVALQWCVIGVAAVIASVIREDARGANT